MQNTQTETMNIEDYIFQKEAQESIAQFYKTENLLKRGFLLSIAPGLGKTLISLQALNELQNCFRVLILLPKCLKQTWKTTISQFFKDFKETVGDTCFIGDRMEIDFIHFERFRMKTLKPITTSYNFVIVDEAHCMKNSSSKLYKTFSELYQSLPESKFLFLTGTAFVNADKDVLSILEFVDAPNIYHCSWDSVTLPCKSKIQHYNHELELDDRHKALYEKLFKYLEFQPKMLKYDFLQRFINDPNVLVTKMLLNPKPINKKRKSSFLTFDLDNDDINPNEPTIEEESTTIQESNVKQYKTESFKSILEGFPLEDTPMIDFVSEKFLKVKEIVVHHQTNRKDVIVIFSRFIDVLQNLCLYLKNENIACKIITGKTKLLQRQRKLKAYTENPDSCKKKVLLCSTKTSGLGLNFDFASTLILMDLYWNYSTSEQIFSRIHRLNSTSLNKDLDVHWLSTKDTIEVEFLKINIEKENEKDRIYSNWDSLETTTASEIKLDFTSKEVDFGALSSCVQNVHNSSDNGAEESK